ncbi:hypothetical protein [Rheinheimera sp.]|uniref:hypothetical protein n=1 Tax=Rheinheimera sp. TaxID=1869214 RepID=UPI00307D28F9
MKNKTLVACFLVMSLSSLGTQAEPVCEKQDDGSWVCIDEPIIRPMGPGSGGTGGDDEDVELMRQSKNG